MRLRKLINRRRNQKSSRRNSAHVFGRRWPDKYSVNLGENRFIELINSSSQGFLIHNFEFAPLFINLSYAEILGYTIDDVNRIDNIKHFYSLREIPRLKGYLRARQLQHSSDKSPTIYEIEATHKMGHKIILQHAVNLIEWRGTAAVLLMVNDITEKYNAQQALEENERRFRDFAESASDWCWEMDRDLRYTFISDPCEKITRCSNSDILGLTREEFMVMNIEKGHVSEEEKISWEQHIATLKRHDPFTDFVYSWHRDDGTIIVLNINGKPIYNDQGEFIGYRGAAKDITAERNLTEQLNFKATHDELTGLINRGHFDSELHKLIDDVHISNNEHVLVYMDLDRFKIVNDSCGHMAGDELLQQLAVLFKSVFDEDDILSRLGGDEFAVIMHNCSIDKAVSTINQLHESMDEFRFIWDEKTFTIGVSVGLVAINRDSESVSDLLRNADSACYMAKDTGRNKAQIFSENDADLSKRQGEMTWAARITQALEEDAFELYAQAILPLQNGSDVFYELLLRMRDGKQLIQPQIFLPAAERFDISMHMDKWVLRNALNWIDTNRNLLSTTKLIFINLSGKTIGQKSFLDYIIRLFNEYQVPPEKICFEITETSAIINLAEAIKFITQLKEHGCFFALDDFGSGVSSYAYLKNLPVDYLKIDGMFIRDMYENAVNMSMVKSINEISHIMGKKTIAECVETDKVLALLRNLGVDYGQGYIIHEPAPLQDLKDVVTLRYY